MSGKAFMKMDDNMSNLFSVYEPSSYQQKKKSARQATQQQQRLKQNM